MRAILCVGLVAGFLALVEGWSRFLRTDVNRDWAPARRSWCVGTEGRCYTTSQCCDSLVCAAFGDVYGESDEIPGYCVQEKKLEACSGDADCKLGYRCDALPHTGASFCVPHHQALPAAAEVEAVNEEQQHYTKPVGKNGLGFPCVDDSDCAPVDKHGDSLCCQEIRRYRQKPRKQCDRVLPISDCIPRNSVNNIPGK